MSQKQKLEQIFNQFLWAINLIPEARELKLDKRLSLVEVEGAEDEEDRGYFHILLDGEVELYSRKLYTEYSAHSVMALLEILNSLLEGKEFKLFRNIQDDVVYDFDCKCDLWRHDACNIVFAGEEEGEPVEDYDLQQSVLEATGYRLGACHYELSGGIHSAVYTDCGIVEVQDVEGDLYIIHKCEKASKDDYAKANKVLEVWIAEGAEI